MGDLWAEWQEMWADAKIFILSPHKSSAFRGPRGPTTFAGCIWKKRFVTQNQNSGRPKSEGKKSVYFQYPTNQKIKIPNRMAVLFTIYFEVIGSV